MRDAAREDSGLLLSEEEFSALSLKTLDGAASVEEIRILECALRRSTDGARRRTYVALARLRGTLAEVLSIPAKGSCGKEGPGRIDFLWQSALPAAEVQGSPGR